MPPYPLCRVWLSHVVYGQESWSEPAGAQSAHTAWTSRNQAVDGAPRIGFALQREPSHSPETLHQWFTFPSGSASSPLHAIYVIKVGVCLCAAVCVRASGSSETHKGSTKEHMKREVSFGNDERSLEALGEENVGHTQLHVNWLYLSTLVYFIFEH